MKVICLTALNTIHYGDNLSLGLEYDMFVNFLIEVAFVKSVEDAFFVENSRNLLELRIFWKDLVNMRSTFLFLCTEVFYSIVD